MYLDSAIIVKLLVRESDSDWFALNLSGHGFDTSELALTEVCGALLFKERDNQITADERLQATQTFFSMVGDELIVLHPLNRRVLDRARAIQLACHPRVPLRTLDALHVATCDLHHNGTLATTDRRLRAACAQLGIALLPVKPEDINAG
ncbi:MAG TPA: type II toxin-antitoxin system VapC family toxin [Verrucomicrobiota bacterium]|nr:type II toxin-antitoxin system VapC family toxin [Verrucomicrobiota bacterium]